MPPFVDFGVTTRQSDYEQVAKTLLHEMNLVNENPFEKQSDDRELFEIVCNSNVSLRAEQVMTAVRSFKRASGKIGIKLTPIGLYMDGRPEKNHGYDSDNASYRARIAFNSVNLSTNDLYHYFMLTKVNLLAKSAPNFAKNGIDEVIYTLRRIGANPRRLVTIPQFAAM